MDLDKFLAMEKQYGLLEENVDGYFFWIYARASIQWYVRDKIFGYSSAHPRKEETALKKFALRAGMLYNAVFHGHIHRKSYDILVLNSARRVWEDDHYEDIYTDDIVREVKNAVVLEGLFEQRHFKPVTTPNLFYTDGIEMHAQLNYYFHKYFKKKEFAHTKDQIYSKIDRPLRQLAKEYEIDIDCNHIVDFIMPELYKYQIKKKSYNRIVKKIVPKVILEVNSEASDCMAVTEAAKECGIPVVELQHGTMGKDHIVYNYPQNVEIKQFPDYLFVFSDFWKVGNKCPIPDENIIPVGFPYLEKQRRKYSCKKKDDKTVLLFLSQGIIGKKLAKIAIKTINLLKTENYRIIYKLHPGEYATWKETLPELQNVEGIEVIDNNKVSLYEFFAMADIQIGYASTAVYEGLSYDLDTYIFTQNNLDMSDLIRLGYVHEFTSGEELIRLIEGRSETSDKRHIAGDFWPSNAIDNIKEKLNMLIYGENER